MDGMNVCLCLLVIKTLDHVTDQAYPFVPRDWGGWPLGRIPLLSTVSRPQNLTETII